MQQLCQDNKSLIISTTLQSTRCSLSNSCSDLENTEISPDQLLMEIRDT